MKKIKPRSTCTTNFLREVKNTSKKRARTRGFRLRYQRFRLWVAITRKNVYFISSSWMPGFGNTSCGSWRSDNWKRCCTGEIKGAIRGKWESQYLHILLEHSLFLSVFKARNTRDVGFDPQEFLAGHTVIENQPEYEAMKAIPNSRDFERFAIPKVYTMSSVFLPENSWFVVEIRGFLVRAR